MMTHGPGSKSPVSSPVARFKAFQANRQLILGIHGQPFNDWDDVGPKPVEEDADGPDAGYCAHSSVTFPTWHRPYVTMMEVY